jgi:hypothetical protein
MAPLLARPMGTTALCPWLGWSWLGTWLGTWLGPRLGSPLLARQLGPFDLQVVIPAS